MYHGKHQDTPRAAAQRRRSTRAAQILRVLFPEMDATVRLCYADDTARRMHIRTVMAKPA